MEKYSGKYRGNSEMAVCCSLLANGEKLIPQNILDGSFQSGQFKDTNEYFSAISFFQDPADALAVFSDITDR